MQLTATVQSEFDIQGSWGAITLGGDCRHGWLTAPMATADSDEFIAHCADDVGEGMETAG